MNKIFPVLLLLLSSYCNAEWTTLSTGKHKLISNTDDAGFILLTEQGNTRIEVLDKNKDGVVDLMRLSIFNAEGQETMQVEDSNLDGVMDQRWHKQEPSYIEVFHDGSWYKLIKSGSDPYIETSNGKLLVTSSNGYLQVQTHNK